MIRSMLLSRTSKVNGLAACASTVYKSLSERTVPRQTGKAHPVRGRLTYERCDGVCKGEPNMKRTLMIVVVLSTAMLIGGDAPATDPFVGNWKFNPEKSKMTGDTMRIDVLPSSEYKVSS